MAGDWGEDGLAPDFLIWGAVHRRERAQGGPPAGSRWRDRAAKCWREGLYGLDCMQAWSSMPMRMARLAGVICVLAPLLAGCGENAQQPARAAPPPPNVTVSKPVARTVVDQDEYVRRFLAVA